MNLKNKIVSATAGLLFGVGSLIAQTANTGEMVVMPGTQFSTVGDFNNTNTASFINDGEAFIYANFNNEGVVDFTTTDGYTRFQGSAVQQLSGGSISYFYDVLFDNVSSSTGSFELSSEISIDNEANFNEGIVKNDDFGGLVIFEDNANHTGVFDESHVDGVVKKNGDDSFIYPIGDAQLFRHAAISAPDDITDTFTAKYYFENPIGNIVDGETPTSSVAGVITMIDMAEFWTVTNDAGSSDVLLTLSWDESTTTPLAIASDPQTAIHIVRWDEAQQLWVDEGGIVDVANKTVSTPLQLDHYGIFTLGRVKEELILPGDVVVYNGVTPNGDGLNDYFLIDNIQNLANNNVQIFNRWGVKVFETNNYDSAGNVFDGYSEGRLTISGNDQLPTGTYYYVLSYDFTDNDSTQRVKKAGYLYITTE
ncbi:gliding motility-associated C-terminal domain-containing protein [uncultured Nonlabens sp.]|uniref:gliding motility-associated C-terminal domain-containing protein n=1 Tax=uncultured Nonlabens sp. TaxID=859306 RepID=UPI0030D8D394|tara:strand:+ start:1407 stop:2672 length:1266 start_codon:yes stop_codon:yes gene_type:complete